MGYWKERQQKLKEIEKRKQLTIAYYKQIQACEIQSASPPLAAAAINSYIQVMESLLSRREETPLDWQEDLAISFEPSGIGVQTRFGFSIRVSGQDESRFIADGYISRETSETLLMLRLAEHADCFLDVGANVGYFSLLMATAGHSDMRCYAFEPHQPVFQRLSASIEDNRLHEQIRAYHCAVGDTPGTAPIKLNRQGSGGNTLCRRLSNPDDDSGLIENVEVIALDDFMAAAGIAPRCGVLKIDVEGYEAKVLDGALRFMTGDRSPILMIETFPRTVFRDSHDLQVLNRLRHWGYRAYGIVQFRPGYPVLKPAYRWGRLQRSSGGNYMAFPKHRGDMESFCCQPMDGGSLMSCRRLQRIEALQQRSISEAENYFKRLTMKSQGQFSSWHGFVHDCS